MIDHEAILRALEHPAAYPHRPARVQLVETHISWVFIADRLVYKLKKPVALDFVDYSTPERRRGMCHQEVRLNRRLAPDIYLGVRGIRELGNGVGLTDEDDPRAVDYVVEMRRYDEEHTVASRLARGQLTRAGVRAIGEALARFHADAPHVDVPGSPALEARRRFDRNLNELLSCIQLEGEVERIGRLQRFAHAFVAAHRATFHRRAAAGRIREGHGDIRAEHVVLDGTVEVVDCVEFDLGLRQLDVADDLSFLVMDLTARGGERSAAALLDAYRSAGGDPGDDPLVAFYATHRALVRAKVALTRAAQQRDEPAARARQSAQARDLILLAERFAWRARLPLTIIVCGVPASGKTHLARELSEVSGLPHLSSDAIRKRLAGVGPGASAPPRAYRPEWNARTYERLASTAAEAIVAQGGVIVDATFRHAADRQVFASAFDAASPTVFIECQAPEAVLLKRAARRWGESSRTSDADSAVVQRERSVWEPLDEVPGEAHLLLRTDRLLADIVDDVAALLDSRLEQMHVPGT